MCQEFGKRWCLEEMHKRRWTEPRSLELQCWVRFIKIHSNLIPTTAPSLQPPESEKDLFTKVVNIRHLGVHRRALDLSAILQYLNAAQKFADLHRDSEASARISHAVNSLTDIYNDFTQQQDGVRNNLQLNIQEIRLQQAALEQQAKVEAERHNEQYLVDAGTKVAELLRGSCQPKKSQAIRSESPFSESFDIDAILMEAALLTPS